jgi:hypothetical protein
MAYPRYWLKSKYLRWYWRHDGNFMVIITPWFGYYWFDNCYDIRWDRIATGYEFSWLMKETFAAHGELLFRKSISKYWNYNWFTR